MKRNIKESLVLLFGIVSVVFLLVCRDCFHISVSKWIFVLLTSIVLGLLKTENAISYMFFLFPLYVGLPGNYLTVLFLLKLLLSHKNIFVRKSGFVITALIIFVLLFQSIVWGNFGTIENAMLVIGIIFVFLLFSYRGEWEPSKSLISYSFGVAALGLIMLFATLRVYDFSVLMSPATRLGMGSVDFSSEGAMRIAVDPNYMGLFAISSISSSVPLLHREDIAKPMKLSLLLSVLAAGAVALIAMSRAFILMFLIWLLLYLFSQKKIRGIFILLLIGCFLCVVFTDWTISLWNSIIDRFCENNLADGNGRIALIVKFGNLWFQNIGTFLFGVGLFSCNVHCMPLQYLFGGGMVLFSLIVGYAWQLILSRNSISEMNDVKRWIPLLATGGMSLTVPIATSLTFMFPLAVSILAFEIYKKNKKGDASCPLNE